ncbi:MAG: sulfotransferase [Planctomycetes bacterium]|nr:sulfotransferase [Planctomycetota bacterium]
MNSAAAKKTGSRILPWSPRLWHGMTLSAWLELLRANRFAVSPSRIPLAMSVSAVSLLNSLLAGAQAWFWNRRLAAVPLRSDPIFVVGHWRSGTTLLHELLALDPRHSCADTYACVAPSHFLLSRYLVPTWMGVLMPRRRPMDNVRIGWDQPQEDEWALCLLGLPTVYRAIAFPRRLPQCPESLALTRLPEPALRRWDATFLKFLKCVSLGQTHLRLVLKSPTHTARIAHLWKLFPRARFVHVVRDPLSVYPSSLRLWTSLARDHGLQRPDAGEVRQFVLDTFMEMYDAFESQRPMIPADQICDVHYERLVADPVGQLRRVYQQLDLGDFDVARRRVEKRVRDMADFQVNQHSLSDEQRRTVLSCWGSFCHRYGYGDGTAAPPPATATRRLAG